MRILPRACALLLAALPLSGGARAMQAPAETAAAGETVLACGLEAFGDADDRLFGETYAFARARTSHRDPPERKTVVARLDAQLRLCGQRHGLGAERLAIVEAYATDQILLRGVSWYLHGEGVDPARLDALAGSLSYEDVSDNPDQAFIRSHAAAFDSAGIASRLHAAAADYVTFARRAQAFRQMWAEPAAAALPL
jgi:hypothetical protein